MPKYVQYRPILNMQLVFQQHLVNNAFSRSTCTVPLANVAMCCDRSPIYHQNYRFYIGFMLKTVSPFVNIKYASCPQSTSMCIFHYGTRMKAVLFGDIAKLCWFGPGIFLGTQPLRILNLFCRPSFNVLSTQYGNFYLKFCTIFNCQVPFAEFCL